ncbi:MAG: hypothetical protein C0402_15960 [Thermodesulfovibrio sp.]|nr:hypothetical protein [Thermodesulfovibrio sp.]
MEEHKELHELIERYGLDEDIEHIIIPLRGKNGRSERCFLLKRKYFRIMYPDGHMGVFPVGEVIEAIMQYPDLPLRESLPYVHVEPDEPVKPEKEFTTVVDKEKEGERD